MQLDYVRRCGNDGEMKVKKRILFVTTNMACGGVERALLSVLSALDPDEVEVTLMLMWKSGPFLPLIPKWVKVVEVPKCEEYRRERKIGRKRLLKDAMSTFRLGIIARMLFWRLRWKLFERDLPYNYTILRRDLRRVPLRDMGAYDWVFAYGSSWTSAAVANVLFPHVRKAMWFHNEMQPEMEGVRIYRELYSKFDRRFAVAKKLAMKLSAKYGCAPGEISVMSHFIDPSFYCQAANALGFDDGYDGVRILTVGRLEAQKGIDIAIEVAKLLKDAGCRFRWYVIGDGVREQDLREQIKSCSVEDCFVLLGRRNNPYPFFRQCDLYVQPSRFEAYCLTLAEARVFNKPIVCTDFIGADEQIRNGETGIIVKAVTKEAIFKGVKRLLDDHVLCMRLEDNLAKESADTVKESRSKWQALISCG